MGFGWLVEEEEALEAGLVVVVGGVRGVVTSMAVTAGWAATAFDPESRLVPLVTVMVVWGGLGGRGRGVAKEIEGAKVEVAVAGDGTARAVVG